MRFGLTILIACLVGGPALADSATQPPPPAATPSPALAAAFALIRSRPKVDLTHEFSPTTPVRSGFGQAQETPAVDPHSLEAYTIAKDGFRATFYAMVGQYGTHVDPPAHVSPTGKTMDEIPLDDMILPLVVLDDTPFLQADPAHAFSVADLEAWENVHGQVPKGAFAALRTDMSKDWATDPERFKRTPFPGWTLAVLKVLFEQRGVTAIGHEALDTDATPSMESETYVLSSGHYQIEVMTNLDKVPPTGAFIVATWPKPKRGTRIPRAGFRRAAVMGRAREHLLLCKIATADFAAIEAAIRSRDDYEVQEIVMIPIEAGAASYLDWLATSTRR